MDTKSAKDDSNYKSDNNNDDDYLLENVTMFLNHSTGAGKNSAAGKETSVWSLKHVVRV